MQDRFGFSDKDNLAFAALIGLIYTFASWQGGRFARRSAISPRSNSASA